MKQYARPSVKIVEAEPTAYYLMDFVSGVGDDPQYSKRKDRRNIETDDCADIIGEIGLEDVDSWW